MPITYVGVGAARTRDLKAAAKIEPQSISTYTGAFTSPPTLHTFCHIVNQS